MENCLDVQDTAVVGKEKTNKKKKQNNKNKKKKHVFSLSVSVQLISVSFTVCSHRICSLLFVSCCGQSSSATFSLNPHKMRLSKWKKEVLHTVALWGVHIMTLDSAMLPIRMFRWEYFSFQSVRKFQMRQLWCRFCGSKLVSKLVADTGYINTNTVPSANC